MADFGKVVVKGIYSKSSDFSDPIASTTAEAQLVSPTEFFHHKATIGVGGTVVVDFGATGINMADPKSVILYNTGVNSIYVIWYSLLGPITNPGGNGFKFLNEGDATHNDGRIQDTDGNNKFAGVAGGELLLISNANNAGNNATRKVGRVNLNEDEVTVTPSPTTVAVDTDATMLRLRENTQDIESGCCLVLPGSGSGITANGPLQIGSVAGSTYELFMLGD